jgi:RimJ/RimL family protein N-acetyltransferase
MGDGVSSSLSGMSHAVLQTERLLLRAYVPSDQAALFEVFADPYARTFYPEMADPERVRAWIDWNLRNYDELGFGLWAMELRTESRFIGDCGLTYQDVEGRKELEIGYHVLARERGKGFATEAARSCLDFGFTRTSCESICSIVRPSNTASCTVAARIHTARREFIRRDRPALLFYTTRADWERRRAHSAHSEPGA